MLNKNQPCSELTAWTGWGSPQDEALGIYSQSQLECQYPNNKEEESLEINEEPIKCPYHHISLWSCVLEDK